MLCLPPATIHPQVNNLSDPQEVGTVDVVSQQLGPYDVMCGRHKDAFNNIGNRRFRVTVSLAVPRYLAAHTRKDKSVVVKSIAAMVRSNGGRFLQRQHGRWVELDDYMAHDKVGHAMRDMVAKTTAVAATTTAAATTAATTAVSTGSVSMSNNDSNDNNNSNNLLPVFLSASAAKRKASAAQLVHRQKRQQVPSNNNNRMIELVSLAQHHPQPEPSQHDECPSQQKIAVREEQDPADEEAEEEAFPHCEEVLKDELEYDEDCSLSGISFFSFDDGSEDVSGTFQETPLPPPSAASSSLLFSEFEHDPTLFDLEPTPLLPEGDNSRRSSVNDQMLSWLICESHTLFPGLDETMHRNLESANL